jgi:hypothetical protein
MVGDAHAVLGQLKCPLAALFAGNAASWQHYRKYEIL